MPPTRGSIGSKRIAADPDREQWCRCSRLRQQPVAKAARSGNSEAWVDALAQDAGGEITSDSARLVGEGEGT
jgi:hypothetical protein